MQIISYGGGVQTVALAILNAQGKVTPRADYVVMADPGAEMPETYEHAGRMAVWLAKYGIQFEMVHHHTDIETWLYERNTVIPVRMPEEAGKKPSKGRRQCTANWKIQPVYKWSRERGATATELVATQIGISRDEFWRAKTARVKYIKNRFPLLELKLTRDDCHQIIRDAGLPMPPKSACYFCPLQRVADWHNLAVQHPDLFERAIEIERALQARADYGSRTIYLSSKLRPLGEAFTSDQLPLPFAEMEECDSGYCFV